MNRPTPSWNLTDNALALILHAEHGMSRKILESNTPHISGLRRGYLADTAINDLWQQEAAVLRIISTVEAYTDAASEEFFAKRGSLAPKTPMTWKARAKHYTNHHQIDLHACDGWPEVDAGVALRNCLAHGLGNLTQLLMSEGSLGMKMLLIDVTVGGNRMHTTDATVPKLASACRRFVMDVERKLVALL